MGSNPQVKAYPLVQILWRDAADEKETWLKDEEIEETDYEVHSIGFVVRDTPKYLTLAGDMNDDGGAITWGRVTRVPKGMIEQIVALVKGDILYEKPGETSPSAENLACEKPNQTQPAIPRVVSQTSRPGTT